MRVAGRADRRPRSRSRRLEIAAEPGGRGGRARRDLRREAGSSPSSPDEVARQLSQDPEQVLGCTPVRSSASTRDDLPSARWRPGSSFVAFAVGAVAARCCRTCSARPRWSLAILLTLAGTVPLRRLRHPAHAASLVLRRAAADCARRRRRCRHLRCRLPGRSYRPDLTRPDPTRRGGPAIGCAAGRPTTRGGPGCGTGRRPRFTCRKRVPPSGRSPGYAFGRTAGPTTSLGRCTPRPLSGVGSTRRGRTCSVPAPLTGAHSGAQGLYDPPNEHDACGVAFVVDPVRRRRPTRSSSRASPRCATSTTAAPRAPSRTPATAPASSPRSRTRSCARSRRSRCPPRAPTPWAPRSCPTRRPEAARARTPIERIAARGGPARSSAGATCRSTPALRRAHRGAGDAALPPAVRRRGRPAGCSAIAPGAAGLLPAQAGRARGRRLLPVAVEPDPGLQGDAHHRPAAAVLPRPARPAVRQRAGPGPLPVLDQHLPVLAAGAPVPLIAHNGEINTVRGNRNWMAAREACCASDLIPGDLSRLFPICTPGRERLGVLRRGARAAAPRRPVAAARRADDDPGGVGEPRRDGPGAQGVLRVPRLADGAVGRPGLHHLHRRQR